eukprot:TRINITY_DN3586_c1_g1_i5.p2 TRINITY_DN3586_c1_g1~~TRINITY_DN3586_c1_g1_i5.p2  ORF type:complete len:226 (+),score=-10.60 TRINITY_DN3586_c1_g1_i5:394-1071(+)
MYINILLQRFSESIYVIIKPKINYLRLFYQYFQQNKETINIYCKYINRKIQVKICILIYLLVQKYMFQIYINTSSFNYYLSNMISRFCSSFQKIYLGKVICKTKFFGYKQILFSKIIVKKINNYQYLYQRSVIYLYVVIIINLNILNKFKYEQLFFNQQVTDRFHKNWMFFGKFWLTNTRDICQCMFNTNYCLFFISINTQEAKQTLIRSFQSFQQFILVLQSKG